MTLKEARGSYYEFSAKLSEIVRQLSFAGIAVIWMFKTGTAGISFDSRLICPLIFFVGALGFDLVHYVYGSLAWGFYSHRKEKEGYKDSEEVDPHDAINWPSIAFFWIKSFLCIIAYLLLFIYLKNKI